MKKVLSLLFSILMLLTAGCGIVPVAAVTPTPSPVPTPTPVPTPVPVVAVAADESLVGFWEGIRTCPANDGASVQPVEGDLSGLGFPGAAVLLVYLTEAEPDYAPLLQAMERGIHVAVYAPDGQAVPEEIPALIYRDAGAAEAALESAITYPPHDTPVRLWGAFASGGTAAHQAFSAAAKEGKVFVKATYYADDTDTEFSAWIEQRLSRNYPGMIDGIYAETAQLALEAASALRSAGRTDIEVFSAEVDDAVLTGMLESPGILVSAAGANPLRAGRLLREYAASLLVGIRPESRELLPRIFASDTLEADWASLSEQ